jgi:hypothetical protein
MSPVTGLSRAGEVKDTVCLAFENVNTFKLDGASMKFFDAALMALILHLPFAEARKTSPLMIEHDAFEKPEPGV